MFNTFDLLGRELQNLRKVLQDGVASILQKLGFMDVNFSKNQAAILAKLTELEKRVADNSLAMGLQHGEVMEALEFLLLQSQEQARVLERLEEAILPSEAVSIKILYEGFPIGATMIQLTDLQKVSAIINPINLKGKPAKVDGVPTWNSSNPDVATVTASEDGKSAVITAVAEGTTQISVSADADLGEGVRTISGQDDITVLPSEAVSMGIAFGTPEPQ